jgi:hypothetical protein
LQRRCHEAIDCTDFGEDTKGLTAYTLRSHLVIPGRLEARPGWRAKNAAGATPQQAACQAITEASTRLWRIQEANRDIDGQNGEWRTGCEQVIQLPIEAYLRLDRPLQRNAHCNPACPATIYPGNPDPIHHNLQRGYMSL